MFLYTLEQKNNDGAGKAGLCGEVRGFRFGDCSGYLRTAPPQVHLLHSWYPERTPQELENINLGDSKSGRAGLFLGKFGEYSVGLGGGWFWSIPWRVLSYFYSYVIINETYKLEITLNLATYIVD